MREYAFSVTNETRLFSDLVIKNLMRFGDLSEADAMGLLHRVWSDLPKFEDDDHRLHEPPYYHAMCILHHPELGDNRPEWWKDKQLWPPPPDVASEW